MASAYPAETYFFAETVHPADLVTFTEDIANGKLHILFNVVIPLTQLV